MIAVIGDLITDKYVETAPHGVDQATSAPRVRVTGVDVKPGGAGLVADVIRAYGADVRLYTLSGQRALFGGPFASGVERYSGYGVSAVKTRYMTPSGQLLLRVDSDLPVGGAETAAEDIVAGVMDAGPDAVIISDYGKGAVWWQLANALIKECRTEDVPVVLDSKSPWPAALASKPTLFTPNRQEAEALNGGAEDLPFTMRMLAENTLVTCGPQEARFITQGEEVRLPTQPDSALFAVDSTGAGDVIAATAGYMLARGFPVLTAVETAIAAATASCRLQNTNIVPLHKVRLLGGAQSLYSSRVYAAMLLRSARHAGARVGVTNGVFDRFHPGHRNFLADVRQECDFFVVLLNSDLSCAALGREIAWPALDRRAVLLDSRHVDVVLMFNEESPVEMFASLAPFTYFKGVGDLKNMEETARLEELGCNIRCLPRRGGYSSTQEREREPNVAWLL